MSIPFFLQNNPSPLGFQEVSRYWDAQYLVTSSGERVSNWLDMKLGTDLAQASGAAQPILLPHSGTNYLWLPGVAANWATSPDSAAVSFTGDIDLRADVALADWTPATGQALIGRRQGFANEPYYMIITTGGAISLGGYNGGNQGATSTVATGFTDGTRHWVRATRVASTGVCNFYTSEDGVTWAQLGTADRPGGAGAMVDGADKIEVGAILDGTQNATLCRIYRAQIYNGIAGTLVFDANFTAVAEGATTFTESSSNAATVTINSAGAKPAQIVGRQWLLGDAAAYFMEAAFTNNAPYFVCAAVQFNTWASADVLFDGATANSFAAQQITGTPQIRMHDGSADTSTVSPTLKTRYILFASQAADGSTRYRLNLGTAITGTLSATAMAGLSILGDGAGANNIGAQLAAVAQGPVQPTVDREEQIIRAMGAQAGISI